MKTPRRKTYSPTYCNAHKQTKPCTICARVVIKLKAIWQSPERKAKHQEEMKQRINAWFNEEVDLLKSLAGSCGSEEIAKRINILRKSYGLPPRDKSRVLAWAELHRISLLPTTVHSTSQAARMLGVHVTTIQYWNKNGWIKGKSWGQHWVYSETEMMQLITDRPWLVDVQKIPAGTIRNHAEVILRRNPWLKTSEIAKLVPIHPDTLLNYVKDGKIIANKRSGLNGVKLIQASDIPRIRELLAEAAENRKQFKKQEVPAPEFAEVSVIEQELVAA